jgi:hypothetical protein
MIEEEVGLDLRHLCNLLEKMSSKERKLRWLMQMNNHSEIFSHGDEQYLTLIV